MHILLYTLKYIIAYITNTCSSPLEHSRTLNIPRIAYDYTLHVHRTIHVIHMYNERRTTCITCTIQPTSSVSAEQSDLQLDDVIEFTCHASLI